MGNIDSMPIASQIKSFGEFCLGDSESALRKNFQLFHKQSLIKIMTGDIKSGIDLQVKFSKDMEVTIDNIPVAGHLKGAVMYALGDKAEASEVLKTASRATLVAAGGFVGMGSLGPVGAIAGGAAGGVVTDGIITAVNIMENGPMAEPSGVLLHALSATSEEDPADFLHRRLKNIALMHVADGVNGLMQAKGS